MYTLRGARQEVKLPPHRRTMWSSFRGVTKRCRWICCANSSSVTRTRRCDLSSRVPAVRTSWLYRSLTLESHRLRIISSATMPANQAITSLPRFSKSSGEGPIASSDSRTLISSFDDGPPAGSSTRVRSASIKISTAGRKNERGFTSASLLAVLAEATDVALGWECSSLRR